MFTESEIYEKRKDGNVMLGFKPIEDFEKHWITNAKIDKMHPVNENAPYDYLIYNLSDSKIDKHPVYISDYETRVSLSNNFLIFTRLSDIEKNIKIPLRKIASLNFLGPSNSSIQSILKLNELNIPVFFCRSDGKVLLSAGLENNFDLWLKQNEYSKDIYKVLKFSKVYDGRQTFEV